MPSLPPSNISLTYSSPSSTPHLTYLPLKDPASNQLIIKVRYAAINPCDIQLWHSTLVGWARFGREGTMGWDYSGTIAAVGDSLKGKWEVGDEVLGLCDGPAAQGTFTKYLTISDKAPIARKPKGWTLAEAAAVPLVTLTAFACLDRLPPAKPFIAHRRVVVSGASGGTGMWCVQLAKKVYDCHVTAICSGQNADFVRELGADEVIDYTTPNVPQALVNHCSGGLKFDMFIDCVGGTGMFGIWREIIQKEGTYITIVGDKTSRTVSGPPLTYFTYPAQVLRHCLGWVFGPRYAAVILYDESKYLEQVTRLTDKNEVKVVVQEIIEGILEEGSEKEAWERASTLLEQGRIRGKVVLKVQK
ncbi:NAD(P)-binding protein [Bimuria novae-zelandiae CBS 107.79]|uniref:NAD(P)-binding protein n=1 Tax=Bimuria novae-zelandiae CBS 107.79 TaxID=1447943 RepID=A0A6A5VJW4_9PLEO|nr:NAD(P)-binding protein [Bimuria novae-zelandiae CBS 107.79]